MPEDQGYKVGVLGKVFIVLLALGGAVGLYQHIFGGGEFAVAPGQSVRRYSGNLQVNLKPDNDGKRYADVMPQRVDAPSFISIEVLSSRSGGKYRNAAWVPAASFNYRLAVRQGAPEGTYDVSMVFPSGYSYSVRFAVDARCLGGRRRPWLDAPCATDNARDYR